MSRANLLTFLERNSLCIPTYDPVSVPVLLSDSKGRYLRQLHQARNLDIDFLDFPGLTTVNALGVLQAHLPRILRRRGKPAVVYIWTGTCDLTQKQGRFLTLRDNRDSCLQDILTGYRAIKHYASSLNCTVKFITVPYYSVEIYNQYKGHPASTQFRSIDKEVKLRISRINSAILNLNREFGRNTLSSLMLIW